jgi:hypothetical protein
LFQSWVADERQTAGWNEQGGEKVEGGESRSIVFSQSRKAITSISMLPRRFISCSSKVEFQRKSRFELNDTNTK